MESFGKRRSQLLEVYPQALESAAAIHRDRALGQASFFDGFGGGLTSEIVYRDIPELIESERLQGEKDLLGYYVTGHPLAEYEREMRSLSTRSAAEIAELEPGESIRVRMVGTVTAIRKRKTRSGDVMADVVLEDLTGEFQVVIFPRDFETYQPLLVEGAILVVEGKAGLGRERVEVTLDSMKPLKAAWEECVRAIHIDLFSEGLESETLENLKRTFKRYRGKARIYFHVKTPRHGEVVVQAQEEYLVSPSRDLVYQIEDILEQDVVAFDVAPYKPRENANGSERGWNRGGASPRAEYN